ncbi:hypothetical protein [Thermodesulfovibrio sp. 3462-1]|uniref:DUF1640 domain-containing protein n=1 Tax=Thermodesulfovibrio obliviosus TaxID=3118332 RepID=A0AAU8H5K4_9BACT
MLYLTMPVTEIEIYDALRNKIGEESAKTLLEFIDLRVEKEFERKKDLLATKQDIVELRSATKQDIAELRNATKQDIAELRAEVKQDIAELKAELEVKIEKVKTTLIKWMFIFWAGQVGVLVAILTLFFRVLK